MDSQNMWQALIGKNKVGRSVLIEQSNQLAIIQDNWKYIRPSKGKAYYADTHTDSGNLPTAQLYNLSNDLGEKTNLADKYPDKVLALENLLKKEETRVR